ncbi:plectin-like isoform X2 [Mya arenaria]|uniref:plectin-like isoform X2 n=1 Tax=Mya arenaria TaxID=6604 RepID=UPI0022E48774|nr:plectin-like isoform X2 [Mya arenaria]
MDENERLPKFISYRAPRRPASYARLFQETFASLRPLPKVQTCITALHTQSRAEKKGDGAGQEDGIMSSPPKKHLTDVRYSTTSPTRHGSHGEGQGPAREISSLSREGSPAQGHQLSGSPQTGDTRDGAGKRKQAGRSLTPDSRYMLDKEMTESQNRKLEGEVSTLRTENKLLKDKYNRANARIGELESELSEARDDLSTLQDDLDHEMTELTARTRQEMDRDRSDLQARVVTLTKENETLKMEMLGLERRLVGAQTATELAQSSDKTRTLEAHSSEIASLKEELTRVRGLLAESERQVHEGEERHAQAHRDIQKLTKFTEALQQQTDAGNTPADISNKQVRSLERRLKVTEERLHQERADRANNLSSVEDKLLTDNAKLQASEKELTRQLHREKEKNRNFEQRVKQLREENEKLRLAMPFDDTSLLSKTGTSYDIPYSSHTTDRAETLKSVSEDMNYIMSQIEQQDGLQGTVDRDEVIRVVWNKRELAYRHLKQYDFQLQELQLSDNNLVDGLKNLRETYGQAEGKLASMEEELADARSLAITLEHTYKQQLEVLVQERHNAFASLKTAEDLLAAVRAENETLHQNVALAHTHGMDHRAGGKDSETSDAEMLRSEVLRLTRANKLMEGELSTLRIQLNAREIALKDVESELSMVYGRLKGEDSDDRKQQRIDKLSAEVKEGEVELSLAREQLSRANGEVSRLQAELTSLKKQNMKNRSHKTEQIETRVLQELRGSLAEREGDVAGLSRQLDDTENNLQKLRQDLYIEQMHNSELEAENENLQETVAQRAQMFEALSGTEREQLAQYQILKDAMDNASQELAQKHAQIISLDVNLSSQKDKCAELVEELARLHNSWRRDDTQDTPDQLPAHQLQVRELEKERAQLKQELQQAYSAIQASEEQYRTLQTESAQLEQELVKEKTVILQITAEKGEIEQHLEELAEEHESLITEKNTGEEDLVRLETKLQEILHKYEAQSRKQHGDFTKEHQGIPPEASKLVSELDSLRLVVDGKDKEIAMLHDKLSRQGIELDFLHRKVELVHRDSVANREDVARMISELTLKMKEAVSTREVSQLLVTERTKLANEKQHLEAELDQERRSRDEQRREIHDIIRKIENTETSKKSTEKNSRDKENTIISLEAELRNTKHNLASSETENDSLKNRLDHMIEDVRNLTAANTSLEKRLEMEQHSLSEKKSEVLKWKEDFTKLAHDCDIIRHEHSVLSDKYETEIKMVQKLKGEVALREEENGALRGDLKVAQQDRDTHHGQLLITKDTLSRLTQDKGSIEHDYEGLCRSLTEKERQLTELRERMEERLESLKREHAQEQIRLEQDRNAATQERDLAKGEMDKLNKELRQKEVQLNTFSRTLQELEAITREKKQLESQVERLEASTGDSQVLLEGHRRDLMQLNEALAKQQERTILLESENHTLAADLKALKNSSNREEHELKLTITELKAQHENERHYLNDNLAQTQSRLRSVETSLASAAGERDTALGKLRLHEKTVEDLRAKLADENTARRLTEQSVGTLRLQLEEARNEKNVSQARYVEMKAQVSRAEESHHREEEKSAGLAGQLAELTAITSSHRAALKAKTDQVDLLQKEVSSLKQMIESQKQTWSSKLKKAALEARQQMEGVNEEKSRLAAQLQASTVDLDSAREHIANKNKENLKLQEEILSLEDRVREAQLKQKHADDTLQAQIDRQQDLNTRFEAQDEELKRLRSFLARKADEAGEADKAMWQEMNRVIQELSHQMQSHLDAQRGGDKEGKGRENAATRFRRQLAEVTADLNTERSLHQITRTSLSALEEDCTRIRKQLQTLRHRHPQQTEKKHKNRMEAINAIIARSQSQAQALLTSGGYYDDSMLSPRGLGNPIPRVGLTPRRGAAESPDNSISEDLSIASLPPMHYGKKS